MKTLTAVIALSLFTNTHAAQTKDAATVKDNDMQMCENHPTVMQYLDAYASPDSPPEKACLHTLQGLMVIQKIESEGGYLITVDPHFRAEVREMQLGGRPVFYSAFLTTKRELYEHDGFRYQDFAAYTGEYVYTDLAGYKRKVHRYRLVRFPEPKHTKVKTETPEEPRTTTAYKLPSDLFGDENLLCLHHSANGYCPRSTR